MTRARPRDPATADPGEYLPILAQAAAVKRRKLAQPLTWSEALAEAPWEPAAMPAAWERAFRRAYAEALVERGLALPAMRSGSTGAGGANTHPMINVRAPKRDQTRWRAVAARAGLSYSEWVRRMLEMGATR